MFDERLAGLLSSLIVGVPWALWHAGLYQNGPVYMAFLALLLTSYTVVIYLLVYQTEFNVWIATLFHFSVNVANLLFLSVINSTTFMMVNAIAWAILAAIIVGIRRGFFLRVLRNYRLT